MHSSCVEGHWTGSGALLHALHNYMLRAKIILADFNLVVSTTTAYPPCPSMFGTNYLQLQEEEFPNTVPGFTGCKTLSVTKNYTNCCILFLPYPVGQGWPQPAGEHQQLPCGH